MHRAGAALAGIAAHVGAGQLQVLSQRVDQQGVGRYVNTGSAPVDLELDLHLAVSSSEGDGWIGDRFLARLLPG
jgi:hypothetical protein